MQTTSRAAPGVPADVLRALVFGALPRQACVKAVAASCNAAP